MLGGGGSPKGETAALRRMMVRLLPRNSRGFVRKYLLYCVAAACFFQVVFVFLYLRAPPPQMTPVVSEHGVERKATVEEAGSEDDASPADFWNRNFKNHVAVHWNEFAIHILLEYASEISNLTAELAPILMGYFDLNSDKQISRKEFYRFLQKYGEEGLAAGLRAAVDSSLDTAWRAHELDRNRADYKGCALKLSKADSNYLEVETSQGLQFPGPKAFCVEAWIRPLPTSTGFATGGTIFSKYNRGLRGQYIVRLEQNGALFFHREVAPWGLRSSIRMPAGVYTHIAVSYGAGRSKVYVNGTLRGTQREGSQAPDETTPVLIGAIHDESVASSHFDGVIDEVRLWNVDRTQVEIESTMHTTLTGLEYGLAGYWTFDDCAGSRARDLTGHHDAILHGGTWIRTGVVIHVNRDFVKCADRGGKCSVDRGEPQLVGGLVDESAQREEYWKRAVKIMESQNDMNRKIIRDLLKRLRALEKADKAEREALKNVTAQAGRLENTTASIVAAGAANVTAQRELLKKLIAEHLAIDQGGKTASINIVGGGKSKGMGGDDTSGSSSGVGVGGVSSGGFVPIVASTPVRPVGSAGGSGSSIPARLKSSSSRGPSKASELLDAVRNEASRNWNRSSSSSAATTSGAGSVGASGMGGSGGVGGASSSGATGGGGSGGSTLGSASGDRVPVTSLSSSSGPGSLSGHGHLPSSVTDRLLGPPLHGGVGKGAVGATGAGASRIPDIAALEKDMLGGSASSTTTGTPGGLNAGASSSKGLSGSSSMGGIGAGSKGAGMVGDKAAGSTVGGNIPPTTPGGKPRSSIEELASRMESSASRIGRRSGAGRQAQREAS
eukprot:jgi/Mesvir1/14772/Mv05413-RA.1